MSRYLLRKPYPYHLKPHHHLNPNAHLHPVHFQHALARVHVPLIPQLLPRREGAAQQAVQASQLPLREAVAQGAGPAALLSRQSSHAPQAGDWMLVQEYRRRGGRLLETPAE